MTHPTRPDSLPEWRRHKERGSTFWLRIMCRISLLLGRRLSRLVLYGIALYFALAVPTARRASRNYLQRVLPHKVTWRDIYRHILTFSSTIHDRLFLLNDRYDLFDIRVQGAEALHALHAQNQGALLYGAHLGSFEMLRSLARGEDAPKVSVAMFPENAQQLNAALAAINPDVVLDIIALGQMDSMLTVHSQLNQGVMIGILADRASGPDQYLEVPFLGSPARFPSGPFRMAVMLRQPVCFMAGLYQGGNRYDVQFEMLSDAAEPLSANREQAVQELLEKYVAALERHCRSAPYNWFNFFDFWKTTQDEKA